MLAARLAAALVLATAPSSVAQAPARPQPHVRLDVITARATALHAGVGAALPLGRYVRAEAVGAAGALLGGDRPSPFSARGDLVVRWMFDPEFVARWAAYAGGGASARYDEPDDWRALLVVLLGAEASRWRGVVPFGEVGYGGGLRVGIGVRRAMPGRR